MTSRSTWHVSPLVDIAAYHLGWLWVFLPLYLVWNHGYVPGFRFLLLLSLTANFIHLHFGLPYAYLDAETFRANARRLKIWPSIFLAGFFLMAFLPRSWGIAYSVLSLFTMLWNYYHTHMQKYGILRLYNAKSGHLIPASVDLLLIFSWIPLLLLHMPRYLDFVQANAPTTNMFLVPALKALQQVRPFLFIPALSLLLYAVANFVRHEWRAHRLRNWPRLSLAVGTLSFYACFFWFNSLLAYAASGFAHSLEYCVFVWAFQRRRYAVADNARTILGRLISSHAVVWYASLGIGLSGLYLLVMLGRPATRISGIEVSQWLFYWITYQSLIHYYIDGFLWRMGNPRVRASI